MTREEAITYGKRVIDLGLNDETQAFCEMAIKALEQEPCEYSNANQHNSNELNDVGQRTNALEGDVISRQAAIVQLSHNKNGDDDCDVIIQKDIETIKALPPVTPQPKTGHWLRMSDLSEQEDDRYRCSRCGNVVHHTNKMNLYTFNSWCGRCGSDNGRHIDYDVEANYFEEPQERPQVPHLQTLHKRRA